MLKIRQIGNPPRVVRGRTVQKTELVDFIARSTGLNEGTVGMVLTELRDSVVFYNKAGRAVKLEGLGIYLPSVKLDGTIRVSHRIDPYIRKALNAPGAFEGKILNWENMGLTVEALVAMWNEAHPDDPVE